MSWPQSVRIKCRRAISKTVCAGSRCTMRHEHQKDFVSAIHGIYEKPILTALAVNGKPVSTKSKVNRSILHQAHHQPTVTIDPLDSHLHESACRSRPRSRSRTRNEKKTRRRDKLLRGRQPDAHRRSTRREPARAWWYYVANVAGKSHTCSCMSCV